MGALPNNKHAVGNSGGKNLQDRKLAAEVRRLTLNKIKGILEITIDEKTKESDRELYTAVLLKLAGTVLPRLNEISGPDGVPLPLLGGQSNGNNSNDSNKKDTETTSGGKGG